MATLTLSGALTLVQLTKQLVGGELQEIAEVLSEYQEIFQDAVFREANSNTHHIHPQRLALPTGSFRNVNQGVAAEASLTKQVTENIGMLEAISNIDEALVEMSGNKTEFRAGEDAAFLEGMSQTFADAFVYGNAIADPEQINGLVTRYNALALANVWGCSGTAGTTTSLWAVQWGFNKVFFVYPKGHRSAGVEKEDMGRRYVKDSGGTNEYIAWTSHFKLKLGIVVRDDRNIQRLVNIQAAGAANIFNPDILVTALNHMPQRGKGAVIYGNQTLVSQMDIDAMDKGNVLYSPGEPYGDEVTRFRRKPIRICEAILDTETAIT